MNYKAYYIIAIIAALLISFFGTAGLVKLICWAFGFTFSWKLSIGVWAALWLLKSVFGRGK